MLLTDSMRNKEPITNTLVSKAKTYRESARESRLRGIQAVDPTYNNITADDYASQLIGRRLTTQEHDRLNTFVMGLRESRAGYVAGAADNTATTGLQGTTGVTDQDIAQYVQTTTGEEAARRAQEQRLFALAKKGQ